MLAHKAASKIKDSKRKAAVLYALPPVWSESNFGPLRSRRPARGLAASLFCPRRVRERDSGRSDSPVNHLRLLKRHVDRI